MVSAAGGNLENSCTPLCPYLDRTVRVLAAATSGVNDGACVMEDMKTAGSASLRVVHDGQQGARRRGEIYEYCNE